jgi:RNA polymerase sigma-70 factor (ECF subfamily)
LGDPEQAEDVAQEAFLRAFRAMDRFDPERPFRPWVLSIAANLARNQRRSTGRFLADFQRLAREQNSPPVSIETLAAQQWEAQSLWRAVRQLSVEDQQVIYYRFFLDLPVAETAQALGVAEGTVKSRLHRALERLRKVISRQYPLREGRQRHDQPSRQT